MSEVEEPEGLPRISDVARLMHDSENGLKVKNRQYHLRTYPNCFVGASPRVLVCAGGFVFEVREGGEGPNC